MRRLLQQGFVFRNFTEDTQFAVFGPMQPGHLCKSVHLSITGTVDAPPIFVSIGVFPSKIKLPVDTATFLADGRILNEVLSDNTGMPAGLADALTSSRHVFPLNLPFGPDERFIVVMLDSADVVDSTDCYLWFELEYDFVSSSS